MLIGPENYHRCYQECLQGANDIDCKNEETGQMERKIPLL